MVVSDDPVWRGYLQALREVGGVVSEQPGETLREFIRSRYFNARTDMAEGNRALRAVDELEQQLAEAQETCQAVVQDRDYWRTRALTHREETS